MPTFTVMLFFAFFILTCLTAACWKKERVYCVPLGIGSLSTGALAIALFLVPLY
ncbi:hypothetical protein [Paenibacillus abyssi]|uniref:Uncharacterized protein n=1 Tax=Paenibacillus abyssi TaxID=1340531 RepID=A0A917LFB0_9BACL|nr:hypothetical protein [Paenibacillus abyssi]GGG17688.1 hypothetical protein GCM10010916_38160 [Paenibacillus abyssi]